MENVALLAAMTGEAQRYPRTGWDYLCPVSGSLHHPWRA